MLSLAVNLDRLHTGIQIRDLILLHGKVVAGESEVNLKTSVKHPFVVPVTPVCFVGFASGAAEF